MITRRIVGCASIRCAPTSIRYVSHDLSRISEIKPVESIGKSTKVQGWIRAMRKMKENIFLDLDDGSTSKYLQVVLRRGDSTAEWKNLSYGSSVEASGELLEGPSGRPEIHARKLRVVGGCDMEENYPFAPRKIYAPEYCRQFLHFRARTRQFSALLRLRDLAKRRLCQHLHSRNFVAVDPPIITSNDCEGAGEVFRVLPESKELLEGMRAPEQPLSDAFFNGKAFLTVSAQLHLEVLARALTRVYCLGPTFRAENTKSRMHLSEFYMLEAEIAFCDDLEVLMEESEALVKATTRGLLEEGLEDMKTLEAPDPSWLEKKFGILSYDEAIEILEKNSRYLETPFKKGENLAKEHELFLVKHNGGVPVFVVHWPEELKPFYMKRLTRDSTKVAAMDLLVPEVGELFGGSVREDDYEALKSKIPSALNLQWYLELRKFGNVPTAGFGMGYERYLQFVLGILNIKDVIPFPRWPHNCSL